MANNNKKSLEYNSTFLIDGRLYDRKSKKYSVNVFPLSNGVIIGMFQGSRGQRPDLDFILKFLEPGIKKRLRTPSHTHWIVDLIIKYNIEPELTSKFVNYFYELYDLIHPFESITERNNYKPYTPQIVQKSFGALENDGVYSLEYLSVLIELFIKCEKRSEGAFMFKNLLGLMVDFCEGRKDYFQVVSYSKRV